MSQAKMIQALFMSSTESDKAISNEPTAPNIAKNIAKISEKYREFINIEINEVLDNQSKQADKIQKLKPKTKNT